MKRLGLIVGSAYSGSSLLTLLFDKFTECYAVGEARQVYHGKVDGPCWRCGTSTADCSEWKQWDGEPFWRWLFDRIEQDVVVDSSKRPSWAISELERDPEFECEKVAIVLSKTIREQFASYWNHQNWSGDLNRKFEPASLIDQYINCYEKYLDMLSDAGIPTFSVTYQNLCDHTVQTMTGLASRLKMGTQKGGERSHTLGGNPAVIAAASSNDKLAFGESGRENYLDGKYADRSAGDAGIRYDESWSKLPAWVRHEANQRIKQRRTIVRDLAIVLGHE